MNNPMRLLSVAMLLVVVRAIFYFSGVDAHACVVSGIVLSPASYVLGPLAILVALATPIIAPACIIASACLVAARAPRTRQRAAQATR
jgi:predicted aconitase with swiveling domain